jgi:hypothetical protein
MHSPYRVGVAMSKLGVLGLGVVGLGAVFVYVHDDAAGVAFASVCLIVGLVLIVASEARGLVSKAGSAKANSTGRQQARILVLVKGEVHAYPQRDGKFQEVHDPNQTGFEFEVFIHCWLLLAAEVSLRVTDLQLTLQGAGGFTRVGERVSGDLKNWHLRTAERVSEEESDSPDGTIRTAPVGLAELDTAVPLECGAPREGWLHFRIRNTTLFELRKGSLELSVKDSLSNIHAAVASGVRHLPGSVRPIRANSLSEPSSKKDEPPGISDRKLAAS